nr:ATP-binding cassette domain-containing protein [Roseburia inulinivorans]
MNKILFKNFHLEIPDSRFLVISGESGCGKSTLLNMIGGIETPGCGKSTLLNMIGGIETPDKGSIIVNGFDVAKKGKKQKYFKEVVGFLFQNFALLENKTVKENLEIIKKIR